MQTTMKKQGVGYVVLNICNKVMRKWNESKQKQIESNGGRRNFLNTNWQWKRRAGKPIPISRLWILGLEGNDKKKTKSKGQNCDT